MLALFAFVAGVSAAARYRGGPVNTTTVCGVLDSVPSGDYTLINDMWGLAEISPPAVGSQCSKIDRRDNSSIAFTVNFNWGGNQGGTKGYSCVQQNKNAGYRLSSISSMPTVWNYGLTAKSYSDVTFNVAYDLFTSATNVLTAPPTNEIMVWPTAHYMIPVTNKDASGNIIYLARNLSIGAYKWDLYSGTRNNLPVWSFVNIAGTSKTVVPTNVTFSADLSLFLRYLTSNNYVKSSDYLNVIQAGTETIKASSGATLKTSWYNTDINIGAAPPPVNLYAPQCGLVDNVTTPDGTYTLFNNLWGIRQALDTGVTGSQCSNIDSYSNGAVAWTTNPSWSGGTHVKSFSTIQLNTNAGTQISKIASMPSTWSYSLSSTGAVWLMNMNVAYDFFTGSTPNITVGAPHTNEIMVWTTTHYMVPVTFRDAFGKPIYLAQGLRLPTKGNYTWTLYSGALGSQNIFTYVLENSWSNSLPSVTFSEDMALFFKDLISRKLINPSDYLVVMQSGAEIITADGVSIKTSNYKLTLNPGKLSISSAAPTSTSKPTVSTSKPPVTSGKPTSVKASSTTKKSSASPSATPKTWKLIGPCVTDPYPNTLLPNVQVMFNLTPQLCQKRCDAGGYTFAGVEFGSNCMCGNSLNTKNGAGASTSVSNCANVCSGDYSQKCGGLGTMQVYQKS